MTETNYIDLIEYIAKIKSNNNKLLWKLDNNNLYNKFTQYVLLNNETKIINNALEEVKYKEKENTINENTVNENIVNENTVIENEKNIKNNILNNNLSENNNNSIDINLKNLKNKNKNKKKVLPLELICNELNLMISENTNNYIKTKITSILEDKKYIKVFGVKKTAEIVSGIVNNKWNISLVLFMSFLLDKKFIYLKKEILFNKELISYDTITI